jgi:hypothetical protein
MIINKKELFVEELVSAIVQTMDKTDMEEALNNYMYFNYMEYENEQLIKKAEKYFPELLSLVDNYESK